MTASSDLFIPEDNPYNEADRGLFMARDLPVKGEILDCFCRISEANIYNFQGVPNYCIVGYKIIYWKEQPQTEADYKNFTQWAEASTGTDTFYFTALPQAFTTFTIEGYCIDDFVRNVRRLEPAKWTTRKGAYAKFIDDKDTFNILAETDMAVNNVMHQARFRSSNGLPLEGPTNALRYRGYQGTVKDDSFTPRPEWSYKENQFIYTDVAFTSRAEMIAAAQKHFTLEGGRESAARMIGIGAA